MQGREAESLAVLKSLHGHVTNPTFILAREEAFQINAQVQLDKQYSSSWISMFTKYKRRTAVAMLIFIANQGTN